MMNVDATVWAPQERGEAVEEVLGRSALHEALQRWKLPAHRSPEPQQLRQEPKARLQMGGRRHAQEASRSQALSTRS